jgi:hypothetical protein
MKAAGDDESGFSIDSSALGVRVEAWGFWDASTCTRFPTAVLDAIRGAPQRAPVVVDATRLKPQREEGQAAFRDLAQTTSKLGVRVELIVTNPITKMQFVRILARERPFAAGR